jgi:molecular chaperone GrpE
MDGNELRKDRKVTLTPKKKQKPEEGRKETAQTEGSPKDQTHLSEDEKGLEAQLEAAQAKAEENYDRLLRITAEFENYKKRSQREMDDFRKFANETLIKEILPIVDNLERALAIEHVGTEEAVEGLKEGVKMTLQGLTDTLKRFGVTPVESKGEPFDPNIHQAVSQEESEQFPDDTVSKELQKGYMLNDRLLRPSMVVVSKKPDASEKRGSCNK